MVTHSSPATPQTGLTGAGLAFVQEAHSLLELQSIAKQEKDSPSIIDRVNAARTASLSKDLYFQARDQNKQARERMKRLGEHLIEKKNAYDQVAACRACPPETSVLAHIFTTHKR